MPRAAARADAIRVAVELDGQADQISATVIADANIIDRFAGGDLQQLGLPLLNTRAEFFHQRCRPLH